MVMLPLYIYYDLLLLTCALTGSLLMRRNWRPWSKLLVILSWMTVIIETLAFVCTVKNIYHMTWYTPWVFLETLTLLYILSRGITLLWVKRLHRILLIMLPLGIVSYYVLSPTFVYIGLLCMFLELAAAGSVLIDILNDVSDTPMYGKPMFWLATGMLFFCSLYIVVFSLGLLVNTLPRIVFLLFGCLANTFMYGGFIACFVALRRLDRRKAQL